MCCCCCLEGRRKLRCDRTWHHRTPTSAKRFAKPAREIVPVFVVAGAAAFPGRNKTVISRSILLGGWPTFTFFCKGGDGEVGPPFLCRAGDPAFRSHHYEVGAPSLRVLCARVGGRLIAPRALRNPPLRRAGSFQLSRSATTASFTARAIRVETFCNQTRTRCHGTLKRQHSEARPRFFHGMPGRGREGETAIPKSNLHAHPFSA